MTRKLWMALRRWLGTTLLHAGERLLSTPSDVDMLEGDSLTRVGKVWHCERELDAPLRQRVLDRMRGFP